MLPGACWLSLWSWTDSPAQMWRTHADGSPDIARLVHRYNAGELAGLSDRKAAGPKPRLSAEQQGELAALVRSGPDLAQHGVVRWRRADLSKVIRDRFGVSLAERSVGTLLTRLGFAHISVRLHNPAQDPAAIEAHKKTLRPWSPPPFPSRPAISRPSSGGRTRLVPASKAH